MNKYQQALNKVNSYLNTGFDPLLGIMRSYCVEEKALLKELVDRATPMKPTYEHALFCDKCFNRVVTNDMNFCSNCGQAIDWSNE